MDVSEAGKRGGIAKFKKMSKEERSKYGKMLAEKRWEKPTDEDTV